MKMRRMLLALTLLAAAVPCRAQVFEVGGGIARGCTGDSSGFCGHEQGAMWSLHGSDWVNDRLEIGVRFAKLPLPDHRYSVSHDDRFNRADDPAIRQLPHIDVTALERSRRFLTGDLTYHFLPGRPVRPLLGLGLGTMTNVVAQSCTPAGCETLMPILSSPVGRLTRQSGVVVFILGASGRITKHASVRAGVRLHNFAGEELSTTEAFVAMGYQFGRN